ncbi:ribonuclease H family protein [Streptococcus dysgalactiae]|uniref:ribonuclease H family protein n=1 Tax=Streptococcus dysgalactiae TaxID=1334 RepID=UPI00194DE5B9|nr:hypothetical protein [Streptococcus dysgalactiae subsp. equisimilis]
MLSHYRRFLPNLFTVLSALYDLLKKDASWVWSTRESRSFEKAKQLLASSHILVHFDPTQPLVLQCDASPYGLGAMLGHKSENGYNCPIALVSKTLHPAEKNYSQLDKEALAVVFTVKRFHQYLWGTFFELLTDHKPLLSLLGETRGINLMSSP